MIKNIIVALLLVCAVSAFDIGWYFECNDQPISIVADGAKFSTGWKGTAEDWSDGVGNLVDCADSGESSLNCKIQWGNGAKTPFSVGPNGNGVYSAIVVTPDGTTHNLTVCRTGHHSKTVA
eukprot:TRINITY_DN801_c0_g1_i3.p1 TRINITY_DN801_c0_g1~~TRINITY_DN801_c0_g1_i3.p1  ORF type:complete len:121 (+),score=32.29 TRINITY_DN801_c0_g1_i3:560-922(+)